MRFDLGKPWQRIDHVLIGPAHGWKVQQAAWTLRPEDLRDLIGEEVSISDHPGTVLGLVRDPADWQRMARNTYREGDDGLLHFDWDPAIARRLMRRGEPPDLWRLFRAAARIPMLAVRGENSAMLSRSCFDTMVEEKPDLVRLTVTGTGHAPTLDEPEARAAIDAFLDKL